MSHLHLYNISSWPGTDRLVYALYGLTDDELPRRLLGNSWQKLLDWVREQEAGV